MKKPTIVTLTDRQVVKYALGEVVTFILLRLLTFALLAAAAWWLWTQIKPWWQQFTA
ncbi:MAG TPA: hypothetical protein PLF84_15030 [Bryobacteraceae bacterium]|mgnify:CR=1 FL=1|nr:hypothetical protein [Bryobacteraceae bacterium]